MALSFQLLQLIMLYSAQSECIILCADELNIDGYHVLGSKNTIRHMPCDVCTFKG